MSDNITTHTVGKGFAEIEEDFVLDETTRTKLIFKAQIHPGGIRGRIVRCRKNNDGTWNEATSVNFNRLQPGDGLNFELPTEAVKKLDDAIDKLTTLLEEQGIRYGRHKYVTGEAGQVIVTDENKARIITQLLEQGLSEEVWNELAAANPSLASKLASSKIQTDRENVIQEFRSALIQERTNESYWQNFFQSNPWVLQTVFSASVFMLGGETYLGGKAPQGRQGQGGVATDFLFSDESTKSFAVVDIKTPEVPLIGRVYRGDRGSGMSNEVYSISPELSGGVVQVRNQISVAVDSFESVLGPGYEHKINRIHPRGILIAGTVEDLEDREKDSFNHFRYGLHSLTIITFDELLNRLCIMFGIDSEQSNNTGGDSSEEEVINLDDISF
jgi:hypothetical protein